MLPNSPFPDVLFLTPKTEKKVAPNFYTLKLIEPSLLSAKLMSLPSVLLYKSPRKNSRMKKDSLCFSFALPFSSAFVIRS